MNRYIDADKLVEMYERAINDEWNKKTSPSSWSDAYNCVIADIDDCPTADVEEVRHGMWILKDNNGNGVCSVCNRQDKIDELATHCRYCGAKMDGRREENEG